ncbi:SAM-dependent methyltransferase [Streptomyces sp. 71268]|uniref:SAM-dependent methyltransferase n=1 Tax=Streptomyces sp. 71268 TaxID=3002640 RepID=UPI0023F839B4|nr:SAM-dependent methyltransferase [Streptomyces sp. 71268]WEV26922.1 SAM-dependent methyltransferase [Streptomyces sp. 71268]
MTRGPGTADDGASGAKGPHEAGRAHGAGGTGPAGAGARTPSSPPPPGAPSGRTGWRAAAERALYGPGGFYHRPEGPAGHFRTSVHASPLYARAVATLLARVDAALGHPAELALVDVGAGRGELLTGVLGALGTLETPGVAAGAAGLAERLRPYAVERARRPAGLDPRVEWRAELPAPGSLTGLLIANEWLDNVPVDVVEADPDGVPRRVRVAPDGTEELGEPVTGADAAWLADWWPWPREAGPGPHTGPVREAAPMPEAGPGPEPGSRAEHGARAGSRAEPGARAEVGAPRDAAWARAVRGLDAGLAVAVDYAHTRAARPPYGTLTGFRDGREVRPVPDGSCDLTAHVALDACAAAGARAARAGTPVLHTQRDALRALGLAGRRPPLALASTDPAGYLRALGLAGEAAELTDPAGLGGFGWLCQPVGPLAVADVLPLPAPVPPRDGSGPPRAS